MCAIILKILQNSYEFLPSFLTQNFYSNKFRLLKFVTWSYSFLTDMKTLFMFLHEYIFLPFVLIY